MGDWKEYKIGELIKTANTGLDAIKRAPIVSHNSGVKCLRIQDISQNKSFRDWGFCNVTENNFTKFQLKQGDIIIARTGATIGVNTIIREDLKSVFNNGLIRIRVNPDCIIPEYLSYHFQSSIYRGFIESISGGTSTQPNMQINALLSFEIKVPPLAEQKAIAEVLTSLDDKIDLLHHQNKTLEVLAETLFRQWFIEESEENWENGTIEDEFIFTMGQSPLGDSLNEDGNGMIFFQGRTDFGFRFPEQRVYTTEPSRSAKKFDTLVSVRAPVGDMNMAIDDCCIGRGVAAFRYKFNAGFNTYTYYKLRSLMAQIKIFEDSGTVFGSIGKDDFKKLENIIPPQNLVKKFQNEASPLDEKIYQNTIQIKWLTKLRDTLLLKLMSGEEVRVNI